MLAAPDHLVLLPVLRNRFLEDHLHNLSKYEGQSDQSALPWIVLLPFLKEMGVIFVLLQSSGISPNFHECSKAPVRCYIGGTINHAINGNMPLVQPIFAIIMW